jgi:uncharacterized protein (DUF488 family)
MPPRLSMKLYTIGFTKKTAEKFFTLLKNNGVGCLIDIRLHPNGQLAGFARQTDLPYFLSKLAACDYRHVESLAPTDEILSEYRKDHNWGRYVERFEALMESRDVLHSLDRAMFEEKACCLLCSEATPEKCHRRLVAERIARHWPGLEIVHLI